MCGTVKFGKGPTSVAKIGDPIPFTLQNSTELKTGEWSGFAQEENAGYWGRVGGVGVYAPLTSFVEGSVEFKVPDGSVVMGVMLTRNVRAQGKVIGKAGSIKLLTRQPYSPLEAGTHPRWPAVLDKDGKMYIFTTSDLIKGQQELV